MQYSDLYISTRKEQVIRGILAKIREANQRQEPFQLTPLEHSVLKIDKEAKRAKIFRDLDESIRATSKSALQFAWTSFLPALVLSLFIPQVLSLWLMVPLITIPVTLISLVVVHLANVISQSINFLLTPSSFVVCDESATIKREETIYKVVRGDSSNEWASQEVAENLAFCQSLGEISEQDLGTQLYNRLSLFSRVPGITEVCDRLISLDELSESQIESLRRDLQAQVTPHNEYVIVEKSSLATEAFHALLFLAEKQPINGECPLTLDKVLEKDKIFLSTGHVFDVFALVAHFNQKRDFINPLTTDLRYEERDIEHIKKVVRQKGLTLTFLTQTPYNQRQQEVGNQYEGRFFANTEQASTRATGIYPSAPTANFAYG